MAALNELIQKIENPELRAQIQAAADKLVKQKKFGLVFEEHLPECTPLYDIPVRKGLKVSLRGGKANETYTVLKIEDGKALCLPRNGNEAVEFPVADLVTTAELGDPIYPCLQMLDDVCNAADSDLWHTLIEADNYHALQLLEYLYAGKVDCIYIDPPYNTGAKDWKYNNDYVDSNDEYRHSKWLSMMQKRLEIAKRLLNPNDSVLIVTIDEKEYLHLGCLLEEMFPDARMQMISSIINPAGAVRQGDFSRTNEFIYFLMFGSASPDKFYDNDQNEVKKLTKSSLPKDELHWDTLRRTDIASARGMPKGGVSQFYPIYIDDKTRKIVAVGAAIAPDVDRYSVPSKPGCTTVFPVRDDGIEMNWGLLGPVLMDRVSKGYVRVGKYNPSIPQPYPISYLRKGRIADVESGKAKIVGHTDNGAIIAQYVEGRGLTPTTQWSRKYHDAYRHGTNVVTSLLCSSNRFTFPKSIYAVCDCIRLFTANNPNALIVDFFAGSGTTLHAVNLLNAEDGGHRRCIMVTNNEVSEAERKDFEARGIKQDDPEWESRGIARYVTWPRTVCSIEGHDVNGNPLKGNYIGSDLPMADGFKSNAVFFKLGFLDKTKVSLGMQFKELFSILWMKAGAIGKCPTIDAGVPDMLILPENKMAILNDENRFGAFAEKLAQHPEIEVVYLVTDYESSFVSMTQTLEGKITYQLYRDYLDNFRINAGRNSR